MATKLEDLRPWARQHPRIALTTVHVAMIWLWLLCVLYALLGALKAFLVAGRDDFAEAWAWSKEGLAETKEALRQEIADRRRKKDESPPH